jgi:hypothetical protein
MGLGLRDYSARMAALLVLADLNMVAFFVKLVNIVPSVLVTLLPARLYKIVGGVGHEASMHQKNARILDAKVGRQLIGSNKKA